MRAGNYTTWPGLSVKSIRKYCPDDAEETLKVHMKIKDKGFGQQKKEEKKNQMKIKHQNKNKMTSTLQ